MGKVIAIRERILRNVIKKHSGCLNWNGQVSKGYGVICVVIDGVERSRGVHREMYQAERGPIPDGLVVDHLCCNPICVNVEHMELVTPEENSRRGGKAKRTPPVGMTWEDS
jgi:hypothetical protein